MATHLILVNLTDQGIKNIKTSPDRMDGFHNAAARHGVKIESAYYTTGPYDMIVLAEGTDEAVATAALGAGTTGNVRTQIVRTYTTDQMREIVSPIN